MYEGDCVYTCFPVILHVIHTGVNKCIHTIQPSEELVLGGKVWAPESGDKLRILNSSCQLLDLGFLDFLGPGFPCEVKSVESPSEDC